ncbi:hypothetical protein HG536_0D04310 [Torulaspora globosa]|uniref:CDC20/Fizzy WD40 domain-containing protein n=1 Tax=Torulaspora globosa TaxID=48254 RepID=A0A7G3ZHC3_9SACH|nr:uncharacterized protein HG536_0D04310 [Torulaspora globosa]QLL32909.1 hypothetical protein HG536_0D04310 [Torulaspora globosa]
MSGYSNNPFISNTPSSSPQKTRDTNRVLKRPFGSSSSSLLSSPIRQGRSAGNVVYADRFIPHRTGIDLNALVSIASTANLPPLAPSVNDDQLELQKEIQAHETFDAVLKNELFGEKLVRDTVGNESSIERITNTRPPTVDFQGHSDQRNDVQEDAPFGDLELNSGPATPRRIHTRNDDHRPSSNSLRGASLLTYTESMGARPSTASLIQSQIHDSLSPVRPDSERFLQWPGKKFRNIVKIPYRVLDAPSLADDFYYDLVDWSSTDMLAVALGKSIFLTDNISGDVIHLCDTENEYTSLNWVGAGSHLAVGQGNGLVEIYDVVKRKCIRTLSGHIDRVACLSWNNHILTSGSRDRHILHRDVRMPDSFFERIETHSQEVCGLKWNIDANKLASGGNDNMIYVYDGTLSSPVLKFEDHTAAVKALAWSPHKRGILASGGGTADRRLKIWNVNNGTKINDVDTGSQVCNMIWSKNTDEIVTSHGYSRYNLTLWDYPTMDPVAILKGHSFRVLHLTLSDDGTTVVSGAGDETLRYWKVFDKPKTKAKPDSLIFESLGRIR